ncbi:hypothetical protein ACFZBU_43005 [Embleya sp. NPDC008237]|uniref:hypothetical protein n=1 Tax=Embleya sp. NPDC008237 TaxID=3363978 RepID=UPI0036EB5D45
MPGAGRYRLTRYEARTGRAAGIFPVVSTAPEPSTCEGISYSKNAGIRYSENGASRDTYSFVVSADYQAAFHEAVTAAAG